MIHFDFDERYQDELVVGSALSKRDGVLLSVVVHVLLILWFQFGPGLSIFEPSPEELEARRQELQRQMERERDDQRFVFVQPRVDIQTLKPPPRANPSDADRQARTPERALKPQNPLPFSRGNSAERAEATPQEQARGPETPVKPDTTPPGPQPAGAGRARAAASRHGRATLPDDVEASSGSAG